MTTARTEKALPEMTIGEIVADDYRAAAIFDRYGIDYCCGGKVRLSAACRERDISPQKIMGEIEKVRSSPGKPGENYASWSLPFLADYIINAHHTFVRENTTRIASNIEKIVRVHGENHPEVIEIAALFDTIASDLMHHLKEEEDIFFPVLRRVDAARRADQPPTMKDLEVIRKFLSKFVEEHEQVGEALQTIRKLARDYSVPEDACNTFTVTYHNLNQFEADLHKHVHLENNILFPKAQELMRG